jgi:DNA-binding CsgD family transcriptional regulator/PAS domain-containing protein
MLASAALIELAYAAVDEPGRWRSFLEAFCRATNADMATFVILYPERGEWDVSCYFGLTVEDTDEYLQKWRHRDPWVNRQGNEEKVLNTPVGQVLTSHSLCPDEILEQTDVYREFYVKRNLHYGAGMAITSSNIQRSILSTLRAKSKGPVAEAEIAVWCAVSPHLQRSVALSGEIAALRSQRAALIDYIDDLAKPLFLVNRRGTILRANDAAGRLLKTSAIIRREEGRVRIASEPAQKQLMKALDAVGRTDGTGHSRSVSFRFTDSVDGAPVLVLVKPIGQYKPRIGDHEPGAAVYVIDPRSSQRMDLDNLITLFGLTRAEASLSASLANGQTLQNVSQVSGVTMNTVRTHLKHALDKTGCNRQAELVALVLRAH